MAIRDHEIVELVYPGRMTIAVMPFSEVCCHMKIQAQLMRIVLLPSGMVQLYRMDRTLFSSPITSGEAGVYQNHHGEYWINPPAREFLPPLAE